MSMSQNNFHFTPGKPALNPITTTQNATSQKLYRDANNASNSNQSVSYLSFRERVEQSPYLVSFEEKQRINKHRKPKKKEIVSYNANRDKLFIPIPEREHIPINIDKNLIEEEKKVVTADLGTQSDKIDYLNPEKPFIPQKTGKDQSTQIADGDLFCFDTDVQPLLTVIVGKTLEQSLNEIGQEDEIATLRETKAMYLRKNNDERNRIQNLEYREKQKKFNNDTKKKERLEQRERRKNTQKQLISRVISKTYLKHLHANSMNDLVKRGMFKNYSETIIKNTVNAVIKRGSEKLSAMFGDMRGYLCNVIDNELRARTYVHVDAVEKHRQLLTRLKEERAAKRREEEENKRKAREQRRAEIKQRLIEIIKKQIKTAIIDKAEVKGDVLNEEINEIDNNMKGGETAYVGVYGGMLGMIIAVLSIVKRDYYAMDSLYSGDNIEEMLTMIFGDCQGVLNVYFTADAGDEVKDIIKNANSSNNNDNNEEDEDDNDNNDDSNSKSDNIDINALKTLTDLDQSTWDKIADVLSKPENNADYLLRHFLSEFSQSKHNEQHEASDNNLSEPYINNEFYPLVIKALITLCVKSSYIDHFNFIFDEGVAEGDADDKGEEGDNEDEEEGRSRTREVEVDPRSLPFEERVRKYKALCMIEMKKPGKEMICDVDFAKSGRKKAVRAPDFESEFLNVKAFVNLPQEHNVLLYDRCAEFILRNKIFEQVLAHIGYVLNQEIDSQPMFNTFNETYDNMIDGSELNALVQVYHFPPEVEKESQDEEDNAE